MSKSDAAIDNFFNKVEKSVEKKQQDIVSSAVHGLFNGSPHIGTSQWAKSEYDANHKIQINNGLVSGHNPPTMSENVSRGMNTVEAQKAEGIEIGDKVTILNTTPHANDVEFGGIHWIRAGYYTYTNQLAMLKMRYQGVIK
jgi:hypothetical protein